MKASAKVALVGAVILVAGVGIAVAGGFIAKANNEGANNIVIRDKEQAITASNTISTLTLGSVEDEIEVSWSDSVTEIEIKYFDAEEEDKRIYTVKETSTSLELTLKQDFWQNFLHIQWPWIERSDTERLIKVSIPSSMENLVVVASTVSGDIKINKDGVNPVNVGSTVLNSVSGNVYMEEVTSKKQIVINNVSGKIDLKSVKSLDSHIEINSTSGEFQLKDVSSKDEIKMNNVSGAIKGDEIKCTSLEIGSVSGDIDIKKLDIAKKANITTVSGKVKLHVIDEKDNYSFNIDTVSGSKNIETLKDASKEKEIDIATTSGSINVSFGEIL